MKWRSYLIFGLLSLVVSALSVVLWMINPFTDLLLLLAAPPLRLLGYHPPVQGWSGLGSAMLISFLWPLTLLPLHWQEGKWPKKADQHSASQTRPTLHRRMIA